MLDHLLIWVNGRRHELRGRDAFLSLSDFLRRRLGLTGTKIVCSEGDCGACSVLIGRPNADGDKLVYRPIDSCIQFMFQLDGVHVITVEGLGGEENPSAVQQAMIEHHGSQCGFCTPGFVVAMTGLLEEREQLDENNMRCGLTGNLCRCTGYTPILDAGRNVDTSRHQRAERLFDAEPILNEATARRDQPIEISGQWDEQQHVFHSPPDLDSALQVLQTHPDCTIVAGATDIGVRINKTLKIPGRVLDLNRVNELAEARVENGNLSLGARASWTTIEEICRTAVPEFHKIVAVFGAPQIRHVGTLGGNIANASPIADSLPFLHVMEAQLELRGATGSREVNINDFYTAYKQFDLRPGELITRVHIPLPADDELFRLYKVSRRRDLDIATFTAAIRMRLDGNNIAEASIAFGAVGPVVLRARKTEDFLRDRPFAEETMSAAGDVAIAEISPISDVRGAADFRYQLTKNILLKFLYETHQAAQLV
jgi:xanthine dehydrogenase small subunit